MKTTILSIIIPAFNASKHICDCLRSIFLYNETTLDEFEVIVVDDGSTDDTASIVKNYCLLNKMSNCMLLELDHVGVQKARQAGANHSSGNVLFFLDSDDLVCNNFVNKIITFYKKYFFDVLIINAEYKLPNSVHKHILLNNETFTIMKQKSPLFEALLYGKAGFNCCHVYTRRVVEYLNLIELKKLSYTEDLNIYIEVCLNQTFSFCFMNEVLYEYVKQYKNKSVTVSLDKIEDAMYVLKKRYSLYKQLIKSSQAEIEFANENIGVLLDWVYAISISNNLTNEEKRTSLKSIKGDSDLLTIIKKAKNKNLKLIIKKMLFWDKTLLFNSKKRQQK